MSIFLFHHIKQAARIISLISSSSFKERNH